MRRNVQSREVLPKNIVLDAQDAARADYMLPEKGNGIHKPRGTSGTGNARPSQPELALPMQYAAPMPVETLQAGEESEEDRAARGSQLSSKANAHSKEMRRRRGRSKVRSFKTMESRGILGHRGTIRIDDR